MGMVMASPKEMAPHSRRTGASVLEWFLWFLALLFVLWVGQGVQQHAQDGMLRWQKDRHVASSSAQEVMLAPLTELWCRRDANFILQSLGPASSAHCRTEPWTAVLAWGKSLWHNVDPPAFDSHVVLQRWQKELGSRVQQWRLRWMAADAAQIQAATVAEGLTASNGSPVASTESVQSPVVLEPQLPAEVLRLQALSNERLTQWNQWVANEVQAQTESPVTAIQAETLWALARSLEGVGADVGARTVRQSLRMNDHAVRAGYLQNMVRHLPWLLLAHGLFTLLATRWMRAPVAPVQQLNGLILLGGLFWLVCSALGAAPSPLAYQGILIGLGAWLVLSWVLVHFYPQILPPPMVCQQVNASWIPGWWLFTATACLLVLDQSLHFHERLRFLALEQWWAWCVSAFLLPLAAWLAPWLLSGVQRLSHALWSRGSKIRVVGRWIFGIVMVLAFDLAHRQNIPQHVTGELLKLVFIFCLCGWCVWKMPLAAQLWHAGQARISLRYLGGAMVLLVLMAAAAFVTSDKGPLLVMALAMAVLLSTVLGWTGGIGLLMVGFAAIFLLGVELDVVGERLQAWRDPFTADRDDMARLMWFQAEAARLDWGFGVGQVPWCGASRLDVCHGLPLQLQSDYTFTALMGWWGPWGAWLWLLLFSAYVYRALVYCARVSPSLLTPQALLKPAHVRQVFAVHLLFLFAVLILMQSWITVAGNLGWLPLTGVTWPLVSYGKSSLWISTFFVGAWGLRSWHA